MFHYPTLNLYLYDVREGLGQSDEETQQNIQQFLKKLPKDTVLMQSMSDDYVELADNRSIPLLHKADFPTYDGYYYPVQLHDSYGLLVNCSLTGDFDNGSWLQNLQTFLIKAVNDQAGSLGQTWVFSAFIESAENSDELVKHCCSILCPNSPFEIQQSDDIIVCEASHPHVIIQLYTNKERFDKEAHYFADWLYLLCYRHKITWAYEQRCQLVNQLKQGAKKIQACEQALRQEKPSPEHLQTILDDTWQVLSAYTTHLDELHSQRHTIEINVENYKKRLKQLMTNSKLDLTLLAKFADFAQEKYHSQVIRDYEGFSPKLERLKSLIEYIRTSVAIREETRDRDLQRYIAVWGIGLAAGAIVASVAGQFPTDKVDVALDFWLGKFLAYLVPPTWIPASISILLSISSGFLAGSLMWLFIRLRQKT